MVYSSIMQDLILIVGRVLIIENKLLFTVPYRMDVFCRTFLTISLLQKDINKTVHLLKPEMSFALINMVRLVIYIYIYIYIYNKFGPQVC